MVLIRESETAYTVEVIDGGQLGHNTRTSHAALELPHHKLAYSTLRLPVEAFWNVRVRLWSIKGTREELPVIEVGEIPLASG